MADADPVECPKCGYTRTGREQAPDWQCPSCGIAYAKYAAYLRRKALIQERPADTDVVAQWSGDNSLWSLVAANLLTLLLAQLYAWPLSSILIVYWAQSVIIGLANVIRMLSLDDFSTEGLKTNNQQPAVSVATKRGLAVFFFFHYGFFHLGYIVFLLADVFNEGAQPVMGFGFWLVTAAFAANHFYSLRYNIAVDRQGKPNIGTMMFTPYFRVIPMHLIIIFGASMESSSLTLIFFMLMKTAADAGMHLVEHAYLSGRLRKAA